MPEEWRHWTCELCAEGGEPFVLVGGQADWEGHIQSRKHRSRRRAAQKRVAFEEWKARQSREEKVQDTLES
jgi:tRNA dimethylallyltransferase